MNVLRALVVGLVALLVTGCQAIGTIFEAGMWVGVITVVLALVVAGFLVAAIRRWSRPRP